MFFILFLCRFPSLMPVAPREQCKNIESCNNQIFQVFVTSRKCIAVPEHLEAHLMACSYSKAMFQVCLHFCLFFSQCCFYRNLQHGHNAAKFSTHHHVLPYCNPVLNEMTLQLKTGHHERDAEFSFGAFQHFTRQVIHVKMLAKNSHTMCSMLHLF